MSGRDDPPRRYREGSDTGGRDTSRDARVGVDGSHRDAGRRVRGRIATHGSGLSLGLFSLAVLSIGGAVYVPSGRPLLVPFAVTAVFGALLAYTLDSERFVPAGVARDVAAATDRNLAGLVEGAGLSTRQVYVPGVDAVYLYVPRDPATERPSDRSLTVPRLTDDGSGAAFVPRGVALRRRVEDTLEGPLSTEPAPLAAQIREGLVHTLEIVRSTDAELSASVGRLTLTLSDPVYAPGFDAPATSFVGVALASGLGAPVTVEVTDHSADGYEITCRWNPDRGGSPTRDSG